MTNEATNETNGFFCNSWLTPLISDDPDDDNDGTPDSHDTDDDGDGIPDDEDEDRDTDGDGTPDIGKREYFFVDGRRLSSCSKSKALSLSLNRRLGM